MKRALILLIAGAVLSGVAAYAASASGSVSETSATGAP
jgi:hypothetical protein